MPIPVVVFLLAGLLLYIISRRSRRPRRTLDLQIRKVQGPRRVLNMPIAPVTLIDVQKAALSIAPKDSDGKPATAGPFKQGG